MAIKSSSGKKIRPQKVVIYAPEGIGKSTLASELPNPVFFDFEDGTAHLDVERREPDTLADFERAARGLIKSNPDGFKTVIIDTVDWLEEAAVRAVVADAESDKIRSIEDFGFGKGWVALNNKMNEIIATFDALIEAGFHVVCLAHCAVRKFDDPKQPFPYDRYELKMYKDRPGSKGSAALVKEWADALLFGIAEDKVKPGAQEGQKGKAVAGSGKERSLYCSHSAAWDAKNRHGLKDKEPWGVETLMKVLGNPTAPVKAAAPQQTAGIKRVALADETPVQPTPEAERIKARAVAKQEAADESGGQPVAVEERGGTPITGESGGEPVTGEDAGDAVVFVAPLPTSDDPIPGIEEPEAADEELTRICGPHAAAVNLYLRDKQKVGPHQSFLSVTAMYRKQVLANPSEFLRVAKRYSEQVTGRAA
jgi:hypothetical protein